MRLNTLIKNRNALKDQMEALKKRIEKLDPEIEAEVGAGNQEYLKAGEDFCAVSVIESVRIGWKSDDLKKFLGAKAIRFQTVTPYTSLAIRKITKTAFNKATKGD